MRLKSLFGFISFKEKKVEQPLLLNEEIDQLIKKAGCLNKGRPLSSNQFSQFGDQQSTVTGSGSDFADRRSYVTGDDPRFIDWKASARSHQTLVKNFFTEVNMPGCIVIDRHSSMAFGTRKRLKITQAIRVGITLGIQILRAGHPLACLVLDREDFWQPASNNISSFRQTIKFFARAYSPQNEEDKKASWSNIGDNLKNHLPGGSRIFIVSDFFQLNSADWLALQHLSHQYDLSAVQIIDQAEQFLPSLTNITFHFGKLTKQGLNNPAAVDLFNRKLAQKLQQQIDWFKKNKCQFIRLKSHDELTVLRGEF